MDYISFRNHISEIIKTSDDKTEVGKFRHYNSSLNLLLKHDICNEDNVITALSGDIEPYLKNLKETLEKKGKSDTKGPLTKVRRLSEYYRELSGDNYNSMTFSEIITKGIVKKFGKDKIYTGLVTTKVKHDIRGHYLTYQEIARNIIIDSKKENPKLWSQVKLSDKKKNVKLLSAANVLVRYIKGERVPSAQTDIKRIEYIEKWLNLPKKSLQKKIRQYKSKANNTSKPKLKSKSLIGRVLSPDLQRCYDEFSALKINRKQPEIINLTDDMRNDDYAELLHNVSDPLDKTWTINSKGQCASQELFSTMLFSFQNFCLFVSKYGNDKGEIPPPFKNINSFEDVTTFHLSHPLVIYFYATSTLWLKDEDWITAFQDKNPDVSVPNVSGSVAKRLITFVEEHSKMNGYLYFCAQMGERNIERFHNDLSILISKAKTLKSITKTTIKHKGHGFERGKQNISFLLDIIDPNVRRRVVFEANSFLINKSMELYNQSKNAIELTKETNKKLKKEALFQHSFRYIYDAYCYISAALVSELSFVVAPRVTTLTILKYFPTQESQDERYASVTFHRKKNRFQILVPPYGPSVLNENTEARNLKNSRSAQKINTLLGEEFTPLIKKFLLIRREYLDLVLKVQIPQALKNAEQTIKDYTNAINNPENTINKIEAFNSISDDERIEILTLLIQQAELNIQTYKNISIDDIDTFFPYFANPHYTPKPLKTMSDTAWVNSKEYKRKLIADSGKFSDRYKVATYLAYQETSPEMNQEGVNIHANRHLSVCTYLDKNPKDYENAAVILNDRVSQVMETYSDWDKYRAQQRIADTHNGEYEKFSY